MQRSLVASAGALTLIKKKLLATACGAATYTLLTTSRRKRSTSYISALEHRQKFAEQRSRSWRASIKLHIVSEDVVNQSAEVAERVKSRNLFTCVNHNGDYFVWPVGNDGGTWSQSALKAIHVAEKHWLKVRVDGGHVLEHLFIFAAALRVTDLVLARCGHRPNSG